MNNKQVTLDIFHREGEKIKTGDVVSTTTSEFDYNGITHCFDKEATEFTTVKAVKVGYDYDNYVAEKSCNGGCYGFDYYKVIDNDPTVEFEVFFKEVSVSGYIYINEADDEAPLRFYDRVGNEQWNFPSNPYPENYAGSYDNHIDYEILSNCFQSTDIIQLLVDNADESDKEIWLDEDNTVLLIVN